MKKAKTVILLTILLLTFTLVMGCEAEFSTAKLSELATASEIDKETKKPITVTDRFTPDTEVIYCTAKMENVPPDTKIMYVWYYTEPENDIEITKWEGTASEGGSGYIYGYLTRPNDGWPSGQYLVKVYLDDQEAGSVPFEVVSPE